MEAPVDLVDDEHRAAVVGQEEVDKVEEPLGSVGLLGKLLGAQRVLVAETL